MAILHFKNSRVAGIACTLPKNQVSTEEIAESLAIDPKRVVALTGIKSRRVAPPHICASDLCVDAASRLLDELGWQRESIDALIFVTQTPDFLIPASACIIQKRLGISNGCLCFDINMGCSGYVYGLSVASSLVESGLRRVLLLVGDTSTRVVSKMDRSVAFLFGDSGSATAVEREEAKTTFVLGTDGEGATQLIIPAGQCRLRTTPELCARVAMEGGNLRSPQELYMNGSEVMAFTLREVPKLFQDILVASDTKHDDIDAVVMHQANQFLLDALGKKLGYDKSNVPSSIENFGNTSCASIPVTITACLQDKIKFGPLRLALMGFGVGWSWGACIGNFGPMVSPPNAYIE